MTTIIFKCDVCGNEYDTESEAQKCELQQHPEPTFSVGDVVYIRTLYDGTIQDEVLKIIKEGHDLVYITRATYGYNKRSYSNDYSNDYISEGLIRSRIDIRGDGGDMITTIKPFEPITVAKNGDRFDIYSMIHML